MLKLTAYCTNKQMGMRLEPAAHQRAWMDATRDRFAYRCLPLLMANQAGWFVISAHTIRATWDGSPAFKAITVECLSGPQPLPAVSHFGEGVLTWYVPFLFRTPPGWNLLARGPANMPKDGIAPLDGLVETDWSTATFTMNWKFTRANAPVVFEAGEPICMIVPQRRDELTQFTAELADISDAPDLKQSYEAWSTSRRAFLKTQTARRNAPQHQQWQKDYFQNAEQTHLKLSTFKPASPAAADSARESDDST